MEQTTITALIAAVSGLVSGAVGSLIAPWVHWGVEKRRSLRDARRSLLSEARSYVSSQQFGGFTFSSQPIYRQLKPYLAKDVIEIIEDYETFLDQADDPGKYPGMFKEAILDELTRLERKWGLV